VNAEGGGQRRTGDDDSGKRWKSSIQKHRAIPNKQKAWMIAIEAFCESCIGFYNFKNACLCCQVKQSNGLYSKKRKAMMWKQKGEE